MAVLMSKVVVSKLKKNFLKNMICHEVLLPVTLPPKNILQFGVRAKKCIVHFEVTVSQIPQLTECPDGNGKIGYLKITQVNFHCRHQKSYLSIVFIIGSATCSEFTNNKASSVVWQQMEAAEGIQSQTWTRGEVQPDKSLYQDSLHTTND